MQRVEKALENAERKKREDQEAFLASLRGFEKSLADTKEVVSALNHEKRELVRELNDTRNELIRERSQHAEDQRELLLCQKSLQNSEN